MIEVKSRSFEAWGPLAETMCDQKRFEKLICDRRGHTKSTIKEHLKKQKKLKKYQVAFIKESITDKIVIEAEDDYSISSIAREYFLKNKDKIEFKEAPFSRWTSGGADGYHKLSFLKIK